MPPAVAEIGAVDHHGPEILPDNGAHHVNDDQRGKRDARRPVQTEPFELVTDDRQECGRQQGQYARRHQPVIDAIHQEMTFDPVRHGPGRGHIGLRNCHSGSTRPLLSALFSHAPRPYHYTRSVRRDVTALTAAWRTMATAPASTNHFNRSHEAPISTSLPP